jgi:hypothetical protein
MPIRELLWLHLKMNAITNSWLKALGELAGSAKID